MIRTYLKLLFVALIIVQQKTECSLWENTAIPFVISSLIAGGTYQLCCSDLPYRGETMLLFGSLLAALKPLSQWKGMPIFYGLKDNNIFKNYQYTLTLAFLATAVAAIAYHNTPISAKITI